MPTGPLVATLLLVFAAVFCAAEDDYEIKVYPCPRSAGPITVDGALDEPAWAEAPLVGGFTLYNAPTLVDVQTFFRVVYDDQWLVFGVICEEPLIEKLAPVPQARDAHAVFHGETVEIFVDPTHDHANYFQFAVSAAGSLYDSKQMDASWSAGLMAAAHLGDGAWTVELAIPWEDLGVQPTPGRVIGFNVCRDRYLGQAREWTNWSQTEANFHDPFRFAHLALSPTPEMLAALSEEFRSGGRRGPIVIFSEKGFAETTYRALASTVLDKLDEALDELARTAESEADARAREELQRRVAEYRQEAATLRERVGANELLDAATWARVDRRTSQLLSELQQAIWEARLAALLSGL